MRGKIAKKIRKQLTKNYKVLFLDMYKESFIERIKIALCIIFKKKF